MKSLNYLLTNKEEKEERWIVENLIGMGELAILYASHGHHKTGIAIKLSCEVITGGVELGATQTGAVMYYCLDNTNETEMLCRVKAMIENAYPNHTEDIGQELLIAFRNDTKNDKLNLTKDYFCRDTDYPQSSGVPDYNSPIHTDTSWIEAGSWDREDGVRLIIIDTLSKAMSGAGVNDDAAVRKIIDNCQDWIKGSSNYLSILLIHHSGKDVRKGMMGSQILANDLPTVLKIRKKKDGYELVREKHRSKYKGKSIPFKHREVLTEYKGKNHETVYVDIGKGLDALDSKIVSLFDTGLPKKEIIDNTHLLYIDNTPTRKSFDVVFNRRWKRLIDTGFIQEGQQGNKSEV